MNLAPTQMTLIPDAHFASKWDYSRHLESKRVLGDRRRLALAIKDWIDDDNAHEVGYVLTVAASILAIQGDSSLQQILELSANNAAMYADLGE